MKTITIADGELKDKIKIHNRKNLYKEIGLCAPKVKINTSPFLNTSTAQINKVRVVLMKVTSTDKILTRYWQTSYNHLEWKTREQQTNCEDENSPPPLLHSSRPPPPGERSGPIRGEITNSAGSLSNPTLTFLLRWKEENSRPTQKFCSQTPQQRDGESNGDFNQRIVQWLSTRPEKPDCQLDSKQAVIRDFGYGEKILCII